MLLPSSFGIRQRSAEAISMDLDSQEIRLSRLEDMLAERTAGTKH